MNTVSAKEVLETIQSNQDLPLVPIVAAEVVPSDDFGYWLGRVSYLHVGRFTSYNGQLYTDEEDDELIEDIIDNELLDEENVADEVLEAKAKQIAEQLFWKKAILLYVGLPD